MTFPATAPAPAPAITAPRPVYYKCDFCGEIHPLFFDGDCRDDATRHAFDALDRRHGALGWELVGVADLPAARIRSIGELCFGATHGDAWLGPLAEALQINPRTLQRAMAGRVTLPAGVWFDLRQLQLRALAALPQTAPCGACGHVAGHNGIAKRVDRS